MKEAQNDFRARYQAPAFKVFQVSLEGNCCQQISPMAIPPINPYTGNPLGDDDLG